VAVVNVLLGWSLVGWAVALAMACRSLPPPPVVVSQSWQWPPGGQLPGGVPPPPALPPGSDRDGTLPYRRSYVRP
jgi:hypothetical protein